MITIVNDNRTSKTYIYAVRMGDLSPETSTSPSPEPLSPELSDAPGPSPISEHRVGGGGGGVVLRGGGGVGGGGGVVFRGGGGGGRGSGTQRERAGSVFVNSWNGGTRVVQLTR